MGAPAGAGRTGRRTFRRAWLPTVLYEAMPWVYCSLGAAALLSGLFLPHPAWLAPYLLLVAVTGLHAGVWFLMLRRRYRLGSLRRRREARSQGRRALNGDAVM
jgi:hypothetical protein